MTYWKSLIGVSVLLLSACVTETATSDSKIDKVKAATSHYNAGREYLAQNNLEQAKRHLDKALYFAPKNSDVHRALAHYFERVGEMKSAEKEYLAALDLDGDSGEALSDYGVYLCRSGKYKKSQELFDKAINTPGYENVAGTLANAGLCAQKNNEKDKADDFFLRALRHNSKQSAALLELSYSELGRNRMERARQYYQRYTEADVDTARSLWLGVQINHWAGDKDAVASLGLKLERMFPDAEETLLYLDAKEKWRK